MIYPGQFQEMKVSRKVGIGYYLDDGGEGILLPKRLAPADLKAGDTIRVFIYHDSDNRLIATTQQPKACVGDIVRLTCVAVTPQGAFLDWGLMKDLFVAKSQQITGMRKGGQYLVRLYLDEQTGRVAATEKVETTLSNEELTVKEKELVDILVYRRSELGYTVIVNNRHLGLIHQNEVFREMQPGEKMQGFVKTIRPDHKLDISPGKPGFGKVEDEAEKILSLLREHNGYLPYHDKSDPDEIYDFFGMSKRTFKMTTGNLFKQKKIRFTQTGIMLTDEQLNEAVD